jgi:aryl-alcohol dehydrogenase-like predicted oxidoreductase
MQSWEKRPLGRTGLEVTRIGFGALEIGRDWGVGSEATRRKPAETEAGAVLNGVLDLGVNLIDTARAYHRSEERIGQSVAGRRSEYVLASKCGEHSDEPQTYYDFSYRAVSDSIDLSLRLLKTEVVDVMQIHFGPDPEKVLDEGETVRAMKDAREAGKVRFLGASPGNHLLERCIRSGDFEVLQIGYSLLDRGAKDLIQMAADHGIGVLIRSGLGGGWLTARAAAVPAEQRPEAVRRLLELVEGDTNRLHKLALDFLKAHPGISSVLVGTKDLTHLKRNLEMFASETDEDLLQRALKIVAEA